MKQLILLLAFAGSCAAQTGAKDNHFIILAGNGELTNQQESIPPTTLFTPGESGLYRVSIYIEIIGSPSISLSVSPYLTWTDDSMTSQINQFTVNGSGNYDGAESTPLGSFDAGGVTILRALANTPVMVYTNAFPSFPAGYSYSLYVTAERLSPRLGGN